MKLTEDDFILEELPEWTDEHLQIHTGNFDNAKKLKQQILENQKNAEKYNELIKLSFTNDHIQLDDALEKILKTIEIRQTAE